MLKQFDLGSGQDTSAHTNVDKCATRATGTLPRERFSPMVLSWPNLPCARNAAIGIGKRTLGDPASLPRHRGRSKAPPAAPERPYRRGSHAPCTARAAGWQMAR